MAESQGKGLKTPVNGLLRKNFGFGPLFGYHNFQNEIDTWETTVGCKESENFVGDEVEYDLSTGEIVKRFLDMSKNAKSGHGHGHGQRRNPISLNAFFQNHDNGGPIEILT